MFIRKLKKYVVKVENALLKHHNKEYLIEAYSYNDAINLVKNKHKIRSSQDGTEFSARLY